MSPSSGSRAGAGTGCAHTEPSPLGSLAVGLSAQTLRRGHREVVRKSHFLTLQKGQLKGCNWRVYCDVHPIGQHLCAQLGPGSGNAGASVFRGVT